jgi:hypothetical protein
MASLMKGGAGGTSVVPGQPDNSPLWDEISSDRMPTGDKKLTAMEKAIIRNWILGGAK